MNAKDSEKLAGILSDINYIEGESEESSDIVLFNTCTVRENANDRLYGRLGQLKRQKKLNSNMLIGICGCMMQEIYFPFHLAPGGSSLRGQGGSGRHIEAAPPLAGTGSGRLAHAAQGHRKLLHRTCQSRYVRKK